MTALVFNCYYNGLAIIRELGRRGVTVYALDNCRSVGTFSRYGRYLPCPDPQVAESAFINFLINLGPSYDNKPVLFPTNDHWAVAIARHKEKLSQFYHPCVAARETVELIIEKHRFYNWAISRGYPVPRSWRGSATQDIPDRAFPLAAKPEYRRISSNDPEIKKQAKVMDKLRLNVIRDRKELVEYITKYRKLLSGLLLQEYVEGMSDCMYTIGVYANHYHEVLGMFTGRKVRGFPPDVGDCVVGQIEQVPEELKTMVKKICREIQYQGIAEFEFKKDSVSGEFKLIEINPRSWSWVGITPYCGVSLPWLAYCDLTGNSPVKYQESDLPDGSVKWVKIIDDFANCLFNNRRTGYSQWSMSFKQWRKSLRANQLVKAEFAPDDPMPALVATYMIIKKSIDRLLL